MLLSVLLLLLLLERAAAAECGSEVVIVTTINPARTANLIVRSALNLSMSLRVYYDDEERVQQRVSSECCSSHDLHKLYPWLSSFASMSKGTSFQLATANADAARGKYPKHARSLTAKAHYIFRKVMAIRHALLTSGSARVLVWADADVELRRSLNDKEFVDFALSVDVATMHRFELPDLWTPTCPPPVYKRALPETGIASFNLMTNASRDFVLAWSGYYGTSFARKARCLNDICVWDRLLNQVDRFDDGLEERSFSSSSFQKDLAPPGEKIESLDEWFSQTRSRLLKTLREGQFAMCPEYWVEPLSRKQRRSFLTAERAARRVDDKKYKGEDDLVARYRVDSTRRAHPCPPIDDDGDGKRNTSPFHVYRYAVHAKGGDAEAKVSLESSRAQQQQQPVRAEKGRRLSTATRASSGELTRWRIFHNRFLSHPFDSFRLELSPFFRAARESRKPVGPLLENARAWMGAQFYDALVDWNASIGFDVSAANLRSTLGKKDLVGSCRVDADAVSFQLELQQKSFGCCTDNVIRYSMHGNVGIGSEISSLLKPFAEAVNEDRVFLDPPFGRPGCNSSSMTQCLGLLPLELCGDNRWESTRNSQNPPQTLSAATFSRSSPPILLDRWSKKSLFWQTSMLVGYLLRPNPGRTERIWGIVERMRGGPGRNFFAGSRYLGRRRRVVGVHVRRGDTCLRERDELKKKGRKCDDFDLYVEKTKKMIDEYGFDAVFVATDDHDVAQRVSRDEDALFGGVPVFLNNPGLDRQNLYGSGYYNTVLKRLSPGVAASDVDAVLDDIFALAHCDGMVAKFTSNVARLAFALSNAVKGGNCVVPFDSIDSYWCADYGRQKGRSVHGSFLC